MSSEEEKSAACHLSVCEFYSKFVELNWLCWILLGIDDQFWSAKRAIDKVLSCYNSISVWALKWPLGAFVCQNACRTAVLSISSQCEKKSCKMSLLPLCLASPFFLQSQWKFKHCVFQHQTALWHIPMIPKPGIYILRNVSILSKRDALLIRSQGWNRSRGAEDCVVYSLNILNLGTCFSAFFA